VFSASDINDTNGTLNLAAGAPWAAGKSKIINGAFNVWQRGTSFTLTNGVASYTADRFMVQCNFSSGSSTATQQTFTPGTAPVAGYESQFFLRITNSAGGTNTELQQRVEDVRTYAGQTVTISFWAKASSAVTMANTIIQNFGSGGSGSVSTTGTSQTLTTSWARYSTTITVPSVSGKTIGTSSYLQVYPMYYSSGTIASNVIDVWGVQLEAGSVATAFQTATGTIQGELAACQRYYQRVNSDVAYGFLGNGKANLTNNLQISVPFQTQMRIVPSAVDTSAMSTFIFETGATSGNTPTSIAINTAVINTKTGVVDVVKSSPFTVGSFYWLVANNTTTAFIGFSAEL
jgi:hypothetical protein